MTGKISIIMPCYRAEKYIEDTLNDILAQTYTDWELICVSNGAGQEAQLAILRRYEAQSGGKIRVITEEKGSVSKARNIGMEVATGRWLTFVDADDRIDADHLQRYIDAESGGGYDVVVGGFTFFRPKENYLSERRYESREGNDAIKCFYHDMGFNTPCNKLFRTVFLRNNGLTFKEEFTVSEDSIFILETFLLTDKVESFPLTGYHYCYRDGGNALSKYHACFEKVQRRKQKLSEKLLRRLGYDEDYVSRNRKMNLYVNGYFSVCNLFKKGSPLSFREACREIRRIIFDDASMREAMRLKLCNTHTTFLKIFDFAYRFRSPFVMAAIFKMQYALKYSLMPLYLKIAPRLRRW